MNPEKHIYRPKWCTNCRAVIADSVAYSFGIEWMREKISKFNRRKQAKPDIHSYRYVDPTHLRSVEYLRRLFR